MIKSLKSQSREKLKAEYRTFLSRQRGLTDKTVYKYGTFVDRFLDFRFGESPDDLSKITGHDIADFLQYLTGRAQSGRDKTLASAMRSFLRFLFQSEKIENNLAPGIPRVAQKYARRIPLHLTPDQVDQLLEAVGNLKRSLYGRRNYAMVSLMARLGLRSPEVIALQLEDIDCSKGEILIRGKGGFYDKAPLL